MFEESANIVLGILGALKPLLITINSLSSVLNSLLSDFEIVPAHECFTNFCIIS